MKRQRITERDAAATIGELAADATPEETERFIAWLESDPTKNNPRPERGGDDFRQWFIEQLHARDGELPATHGSCDVPKTLIRIAASSIANGSPSSR